MDDTRILSEHEPATPAAPEPSVGEMFHSAIAEHSEQLAMDAAANDIRTVLGEFDSRHPGWERLEPAMMAAAQNIDPRGRDANQYLEEIYAAATKGAPPTPAEPEGDFGRAWRLAKRGIKIGV